MIEVQDKLFCGSKLNDLCIEKLKEAAIIFKKIIPIERKVTLKLDGKSAFQLVAILVFAKTRLREIDEVNEGYDTSELTEFCDELQKKLRIKL